MARSAAYDRPALTILIESESITILAGDVADWDEETEMLHWVQQEWEEDPTIVPAIAQWIVIAIKDADLFYDMLFNRSLVR